MSDENMSRGWETESALVVDLDYGCWENLVMRAVSHAVVVQSYRADSDSEMEDDDEFAPIVEGSWCPKCDTNFSVEEENKHMEKHLKEKNMNYNTKY